MLRDNLVELIEPMLNSAGANPLALTHHQIQASGDRLPCLENPRPKGAESSLTETSPLHFRLSQHTNRDSLLQLTSAGLESRHHIRVRVLLHRQFPNQRPDTRPSEENMRPAR